MKFVDYAEIIVKGGNGGGGCVSFRREKYVPKGGPDGGDGGKGGSIIIKATHNSQTLLDLKIKKQYFALNGRPGTKKKKSGSKGEDKIIFVPCGSIVFDSNKTILADLKSENDIFIAAKGGKGGLGNARFSSSTNKSPLYSQTGLLGDINDIIIELRLIAEIGIIGLPNAGKSTLLNSLSNSNSKVADYPFTTLYPNLGILRFIDREIIIADIPGIIKGASKGQGLGDQFLRHVKRTRFLIHLISANKDISKCWKQYSIIETELSLSKINLTDKEKIVIISKADIIAPEDLLTLKTFFEKKNISILTVSSFTQKGLQDLKNMIYEKTSKS